MMINDAREYAAGECISYYNYYMSTVIGFGCPRQLWFGLTMVADCKWLKRLLCDVRGGAGIQWSLLDAYGS